MPNERPKDKGKVWSCVGIMLGLLDRSDEAGVVGTSRDRTYGREETSRISVVQCGSVEKRVPEGQWGDARYARSVRRVSWQPNPAEVAEDEVVRTARVGCSRQQVVPGVVPREHRVSQSIHRSGACEVRSFSRLR